MVVHLFLNNNKDLDFLPINSIKNGGVTIKRRNELEKIVIDYHAYDRLTQNHDLESIGEMFFEWASRQPTESLRSVKDNPMALADDMNDFILQNKDMFLAAEAEKEEFGLLDDDDKNFGMK